MRLSPIRTIVTATLLAAATIPAAPALAQPADATAYPRAHPEWDAISWAPGQREAYERARAGWLYECRRRMAFSTRSDGLGGALIGGVAGGLIGNRLGGHHDRTFGTVAGAAVGALAGAAIDRAESRGSAAASDYCESYLDYYSYPGNYPQGGYAPPRAPCHDEMRPDYYYEPRPR